MTPRERIARLEGLLDRVARNAARPRTRRVAVTPTPVAAVPAPAPIAVPSPSAPKPSAPDSAPVVVAVPAVEPAAIGRASDVPPPSSVPTAPPAAPAAMASPLDSTPPFESVPPVAAAPPVAAPPVTSPSISSVPAWKPEPGSQVQARPSSMPPEELSDDDLVEVTTVPPPLVPEPVAPASSEVEVEIEEPPASSSRSKVAGTLDQAIASAAAEPEPEVPIHTPPPESGPQEAVLPAGIEAPRAPEFAELATEHVRPASIGPTTEQLGETIELEGADGPEIEIEVGGAPLPEPRVERPVEELEVTLPRAEMPSGTYDLSVSTPAETPIVHSATPASPAPQNITPDITARPAVAEADVMRVVRVPDKAPETFAELLDASLGL